MEGKNSKYRKLRERIGSEIREPRQSTPNVSIYLLNKLFIEHLLGTGTLYHVQGKQTGLTQAQAPGTLHFGDNQHGREH